MTDTVLKYGIGYDLIVRVVEFTDSHRGIGTRLHLGIRCHTCKLVSFHPKDITERFCACCHRFHEETLLAHEG